MVLSQEQPSALRAGWTNAASASNPGLCTKIHALRKGELGLQESEDVFHEIWTSEHGILAKQFSRRNPSTAFNATQAVRYGL